jgi:hypothetical protein
LQPPSQARILQKRSLSVRSMRRTDGRSVLQLYQHMRHFLGLIRRSENDTGSLVCAACWGSCFLAQLLPWQQQYKSSALRAHIFWVISYSSPLLETARQERIMNFLALTSDGLRPVCRAMHASHVAENQAGLTCVRADDTTTCVPHWHCSRCVFGQTRLLTTGMY